MQISQDQKHALWWLSLGGVLGYWLARAKQIQQDQKEAAIKDKRIFILLSGKRASGKDYTAKKLKTALWSRGIGCVRVSMGDESKRLYAEENCLSFYKLLKDRAFKEQHRGGITALYRKKIAEDSQYFHMTAMKRADATPAPVVIITDCRFEFDIKFFKKYHDVMTIRVDASEETRLKRGWSPDVKKDSDDTETSLDNYKHFSFRFDSSKSDDSLLDAFLLGEVLPKIKRILHYPSTDTQKEFVDDVEVN